MLTSPRTSSFPCPDCLPAAPLPPNKRRPWSPNGYLRLPKKITPISVSQRIRPTTKSHTEGVQARAPFPSHQSAYPPTVTRFQGHLACVLLPPNSLATMSIALGARPSIFKTEIAMVNSSCYYWNTTLQFPDTGLLPRPRKPLDRHADHHQ